MKISFAAAAAIALTSVSAQSAVTYHFDLLNGGARYGNDRGSFTFTLPDFVHPVQQFSAGAGNPGGFELGQTVPFSSLSSCSIADAQGAMPCGDMNFLQNVSSFASSGTYDVLEFGMQMYPQLYGYTGFYFQPGTFQKLGTFSSVLLPNDVGVMTITSDAAPVPEPAAWEAMGLGLCVTGAWARRRTLKSSRAPKV